MYDLEVELWHGGAPNLKPGDLLLPPSITGFEATSRAITDAENLPNPNYRTDRVYATLDRNLAEGFAAYWTREPSRPGGGWLYRVEIEDSAIEDDEDFASSTGTYFQAPSARILEVERKGVPWTQKRAATFQRGLAVANTAAKKPTDDTSEQPRGQATATDSPL